MRYDRAAIFRGELPGLPGGRHRLPIVDDHGGREARVPTELVAQVGLDQLQRPVGIARLHLRRVGPAELVVRLEHRLEVVLDVPVRDPDPRAAVVRDDRRAVVQDHLGEAVADRAEASRTQRMEVAHARPVQDEEVDTALADAPLKRLGPIGKGRLTHRADTTTKREAVSTRWRAMYARHLLRSALEAP